MDQVLVPLFVGPRAPFAHIVDRRRGHRRLGGHAGLREVRRPHAVDTKMDVGLGFMLLNAFFIAMLNSWVVGAHDRLACAGCRGRWCSSSSTR